MTIDRSTELEKRRQQKAQNNVFSARRGQLEFEYTSDLSYDVMLQRVSNLPPDTIILFAYYFADKTGRAYIPKDVAKKIVEVARVPVFGIYETVLGTGIVGGSIARFENDGVQAAKVTLDILNRKLVPSKQVQTFSTIKTPMFDWKALKRWGLDESKLPSGSLLINYVPSFWDLYKWRAFGVISFCLFLIIMIIALLVQKWRRKIAESQYKMIVEQSSDAILVLDSSKNRFLDANPMSMKLFACSRQELLQSEPLHWLYQPCQTDSHPDAERIKTSIERALTGEMLFFEQNICNAAGENLYCEVRMSRLPVKKHPLVRISYRDITEHRKADDVLRLHSAVLLNMAEGVLLTRAEDQKIIYVNPVFAQMFGYDNNELIGKEVSVLNAPTERGPVEIANEIFESVYRTGQWKGEVHNVRKNGTTFMCSASVSSIEHSGYGKILMAIQLDITERKKAEEELRQYHHHLEALVKERTVEIEKKNSELKSINKVFVGRELKMMELKKKIKELEERAG